MTTLFGMMNLITGGRKKNIIENQYEINTRTFRD